MRIRYAASTGCPHGQFVVTADDDVESAILAAFLGAPSEKWDFVRHGETYSDGRLSSFNFGWRERKA